ncbi:MAG: hypothetical protein LAO05_11625 [Acidobacteriia bacterium]|nr:hypothetical protein [Terriglobia bacterium]
MISKRSLAVPLLLGATVLFGSGCVASLWVPVGPPDALVEVQSGIPGPGYVWIEGYWEWHHRWVWQPGRWTAPPHASATWERGRWEHGARGWRWHRGHWR